jgi:hypothetical protein
VKEATQQAGALRRSLGVSLVLLILLLVELLCSISA